MLKYIHPCVIERERASMLSCSKRGSFTSYGFTQYPRPFVGTMWLLFSYNFQQSILWLRPRWRAQWSVISIVNCRHPRINRILNAYCFSGLVQRTVWFSDITIACFNHTLWLECSHAKGIMYLRLLVCWMHASSDVCALNSFNTPSCDAHPFYPLVMNSGRKTCWI